MISATTSLPTELHVDPILRGLKLNKFLRYTLLFSLHVDPILRGLKRLITAFRRLLYKLHVDPILRGLKLSTLF